MSSKGERELTEETGVRASDGCNPKTLEAYGVIAAMEGEVQRLWCVDRRQTKDFGHLERQAKEAAAENQTKMMNGEQVNGDEDRSELLWRIEMETLQLRRL